MLARLFTAPSVVVCIVLSLSIAHASDVIIGAEDGFFPFSFAEGGAAKGISIEKINYIFKNSKSFKVQFMSLPFVRCMDLARKGEIDACLHAPAVEADKKDFIFHLVPLVEDQVVAIAAKSSTIKISKPEDLEKYKVGVVRGYVYPESVEGLKRLKKVETGTDESLIKMTATKRFELALVSPRIGSEVLAKNKTLRRQLKVVGDLGMFKMFVAINKHKKLQAFSDALDVGLKNIHTAPQYKDWKKAENNFDFNLN